MRVATRFLSTAAVAAAITAGLVGVGLAQDATPTTMGGDESEGAFVSDIHRGSCTDLDPKPVQRLADLQLPDWVGAMSGAPSMGSESAGIVAADFGNAPVPVAVATTEVAMPLRNIVAGKQAINIEQSATDDHEDAVACGNIGGVPDEDGNLFVGLEEVNGSGHHGAAWLHDNGASTTIVVFLAHPEEQAGIEAALAAMAAATPAATPMATPMAPMASPMASAGATPTT